MTKIAFSALDARGVGIVCGLAAAMIWGAFPVVTRLGLTQGALDAYDITGIRFAVSGTILLPFLLKQGLQGLRWRAIALMVVGVGVPYMLVIAWGLAHAQAPVEQFAAITPGSMIVFSVLISAWGFGTPLARKEKAGIALIIAGVALVGWHSFAAPQASRWAGLLFLLGGLLWAIYTVSSKRFSRSALHATAVVSVFSMVGYLPLYLLVRGPRLLQAPLFDIGVQALYQGVLVSVVALFLYSKSVQLLGAAIGATFAALVPGAAVLLAMVLLGEQAGTTAIVGLLTVTAGMVLTLLKLPGRAPVATPGASES